MVPPEIHLKVMVNEPFVTGDAHIGIRLIRGMRGFVRRIDDDGDIQLLFPTILENEYTGFPKWFAIRFVLKQDYGKMSRLVE